MGQTKYFVELTMEELKSMDILFLRILEKRNMDIRLDKIFFGCALKYILYGQRGIFGQGDVNEGLIARFKESNVYGKKRISEYVDFFGNRNLIIRKLNGFIEVRRKSSLLIPLACFYLINDDLSDDVRDMKQGEERIIVKEYTLVKKLFEAFKSGGKDVRMGDYVIINYHNTRMLYSDVINALQKEGIKKEDVFLQRIRYTREPFSEWECPEYVKMNLKAIYPDLIYPYELTYKDKDFYYQNEYRIIVNSPKWTFKPKYYFDDMLGEFYDNNENLNRSIDVPERTTYEIIDENSVLTADGLLRVEIPIKAK